MIDEYIAAYWATHGVTPARRSDDATFLRRASLLLNGVPPTAEDVIAFLENEAADKRAAKVTELLANSRYADYWAFRVRQWILELRESVGQGTNMVTLYQYLRQAMAENRGWDHMARDLIATQGAIQLDGRANLGIYLDGEANEYAEAAMRLFLGTNVACAQCHDDPYVDALRRESYWGLAAFFGRIEMWDANVVPKERFEERFADIGRSETSVSTLPSGDAAIDGSEGENRALADVDEGEVEMPDPLSPMKMLPTPLGGEPIAQPDRGPQSRRELFAEWVTVQERHKFARAAVNRFFMELTGRGFVDKTDGFTPDAALRHEPLLELLAEEFVRHNCDLKWLMRTIVLSCVFQATHGDERSAHEHWHYVVRRNLNSDQWCNAVLRATGREKALYEIAAEAAPLFDNERRVRINERRRLLQEADAKLRTGRFAYLADRLPDVPPLMEGEPLAIDDTAQQALATRRREYQQAGEQLKTWRGSARQTMSAASEALMRMNGPLVETAFQSSGLAQDLASLPTAERRLEAAFIHVLSRKPTDAETARLTDTVQEDTAQRMGDLLWALLQSTEFQTL